MSTRLASPRSYDVAHSRCRCMDTSRRYSHKTVLCVARLSQYEVVLPSRPTHCERWCTTQSTFVTPRAMVYFRSLRGEAGRGQIPWQDYNHYDLRWSWRGLGGNWHWPIAVPSTYLHLRSIERIALFKAATRSCEVTPGGGGVGRGVVRRGTWIELTLVYTRKQSCTPLSSAAHARISKNLSIRYPSGANQLGHEPRVWPAHTPQSYNWLDQHVLCCVASVQIFEAAIITSIWKQFQFHDY